MPKQSEISSCKERFSTHTDEQLIAEKHQWVYHCAEHIAVVQLIYERQQARQAEAMEQSRAQHLEALAHNSRLHKKTQTVAILAVVATVACTFVPWLLSQSSSKNLQTSQLPAKQEATASPSPQSSSASQEAKPPLKKILEQRSKQ